MALIIKNETDIGDFIRGLTLYGVGGGGNPVLGFARIKEILEKNGVVELVDPESIPDDEWTCSVFGMGSIAPVADRPGAYGQQARETKDPNVRALAELEAMTGKKIGAVVAFEPGGLNTTIALHAGAMLDRKLVDGDYAGRAVPELCQTTPAILGKDMMPFVICDDWGNILHILHTAGPAALEAIGKQVSVITKAPDKYAICAHAGMILSAAEMKACVVPHTMSKAAAVGRAIREANERGTDAPEAAARAMGGRVLFRGTAAGSEWQSGGYMRGYSRFTGTGPNEGSDFQIWLQNENHLAWRDGCVVAMSPDVIAVVRAADGEPITNSVLKKGDEVAVLGAPHKALRTKAAVELLGPRHFGFALDYSEIETLW